MDDVRDDAAGGKLSSVRREAKSLLSGRDGTGARNSESRSSSMLEKNGSIGDGAAAANIPVRLLDSFLPGYSIVSALILDTFDFDISKLVGTVFVFLTFITAARYVWQGVWNFVKPFCHSTISVGSEDVIFEHIMFWVGKHPVSKNSRTLIASSKRNLWEAEDPSDLFLVGKGAANYAPGYGNPHRFWYKGNYFTFKRETRDPSQLQNIRRGRAYLMNPAYPAEDRILLSCLGRSANPIKDLIDDAKAAYTAKKASTTTVRVPNQVFTAWQTVSTRPSRSMATLSLSPAQSETLVKDITEYLDPASASWYAKHGIPHRRGYLFHGPPGTGKTSFSLVLAGMFGLEIHVLSLLDPGLTESKLQHLFLGMPNRCIVLLEDVDSAGFTRKKESSTGATSTTVSRGGRDDREPEIISLSCLLNVIDGVVSHEGRILIMTTNYPERIDPRLVRAGRVDMKILFDFATHEQIADLFVKIFDKFQPSSDGGRTGEVLEEEKKKRQRANPELHLDLIAMAKNFAALLPEKELTPAEIQGFLLVRRGNPERAVAEVEGWWEDLKAQKEAEKKAAKVFEG